MKIIRALALASVVTAGAPAQAASVRFSLEEGTKVGSKAVGLICFPRTPLRWERQYRPDSEDVADLLNKHFGPSAESIKAEVTEVRLRLCQRYWGIVGTRIGDWRELKGSAEIEVRWTSTATVACDGKAMQKKTRVHFPVTPEMRGGISGVLLKALDMSAAEAAQAMNSGRACAAATGVGQ